MSPGPFRQPEYLPGTNEPKYRVRCPIHGFIRFSENERVIIDHRLFRRLRWIRQLALTELVYPGATHTRFEHSLGVMEVATRIFDTLARERGELMETTFATVEQLRDRPLARARQLVRLASLLHDIGHCCFSHAAEEVIQKGAGHEELTIHILETDDLLGQVLDQLFFPEAGKWVAKIIGGREKGLPPQLQVLNDIVSGQVDADRTDYLLRDSHHCGVEYGRFDDRRMVECLTLREDPEGTGGLEIAIRRDGIHTFEALILARYQMNTQVYYHRLRRVYDLYLKEYFRAKGSDEFDSHEKVLQHNDMTMMTQIIDDADKAGEPLQQWAERIRDRRHHREVYATDEDAGFETIAKAKRAFERIKQDYPPVNFLFDVPEKPVSVHKLLLPEHASSDGVVQFRVIDADGSADLLSSRSPILRKIPSWFQVARIFADLGRDQKPLRSEIESKCKQYARA